MTQQPFRLTGATPIEELTISNRVYNTLKRNGIPTIEIVLSKSKKELLALYNFGEKYYAEVHDRLSSLGLIDPDNEDIVPIVIIMEPNEEEESLTALGEALRKALQELPDDLRD